MLISDRILLRLVLGIVCLLATASLPIVAAQESDERHGERRNAREHDRDRVPDRASDRERDPDRRREVERDDEQRRLKLEFLLSDDGEGREMVERLVQDLRRRFAAKERPDSEAQQPARRAPRARDREPDEQAARQRHLEMAIEHLQAAGLHDLARQVFGHLRPSPPGRPLRVAPRAERERPRPRPEGDEQIRHLTHMIEELHGMLRGLHERMQDSVAIAPATDEAHRGLDELRRHVDQMMGELERAVHEGANQHVENFERSVNERFEHIERNVTERFEKIERFLRELDERLHGADEDDEEDYDEEDDDRRRGRRR